MSPKSEQSQFCSFLDSHPRFIFHEWQYSTPCVLSALIQLNFLASLTLTGEGEANSNDITQCKQPSFPAFRITSPILILERINSMKGSREQNMNDIDAFDMDNSKIYSIGNLAWKLQNFQLRGNTLNAVNGTNPNTLTTFF